MPEPKKILLAEDDKPMSRTMRIKLTKLGFEVVVAENGADAIQATKDKTFDLILLDIMMPEVDGFAVLEDLKSRGVKTPVIVTSNLSQPQDAKKAKELGAADFLVKSNVPIKKIVEYIQNALK